jgi:hypothetical protein
MPRARAREEHPGTLKTGLMTGSSSIPARYARPEALISSEATKKGNNDGTTAETQRFRPFNADLTAVSEKRTRQTTKTTHNEGKDNKRTYTVLEG